MASRRRSRSRSRSSRSGRYTWTTADVEPVSHAQDVKVLSSLITVIDEDVVAGSILTRVIGTWASRAEVNDADTVSKFALYIQTLEAFNAGASPELNTDRFAYLWMDTIWEHSGDVLTGGRNQFTTHVVDARARRRFRSSEDVLVAQRENTSPTAVAVTTAFNLRILLWIP